ncbi:hypothetical protein RRSWK_07212 [Rhodopirellula sp. SWK7]|nr:hypothetical protein RRSWK_07212 [Rhodopirellula sp. SWK7]
MWVCSCFLNFFERISLIGRGEALASIARLIDEWGRNPGSGSWVPDLIGPDLMDLEEMSQK